MIQARATVCESCGAPSGHHETLCGTCSRVFASVLDEPGETPAVPSEADPVTFVAPQPYVGGGQLPWEPKTPPQMETEPETPPVARAETPQTPPVDAEPAPWWERQPPPAPEALSNHSAHVPHTVPSSPPVAVAPAVPPTYARADAPRPQPLSQPLAQPPTRIVSRPPTPGAVTRPGQSSGWRRRIFLGGGALIVALAMGVPLAERWLFAPVSGTPNATNSAGVELEPAASPVPRTAGYSRAAAASDTPRTERQAASKDSPNTQPDAKAAPAKRRTPLTPKTGVAPALASAPAAAPDASMFSTASAELSTPAPPPPPPPAPVAAVAPIGPIFEMNQVEQRPHVTSQIDPRMPDELRDRPLSDLVIVRVLVSHAGRPSDINVLRRSKSGPALDSAVVAAVRQWAFSPARRRGQAVSCWYNVGVPLRSDGARSQP